MSLNTKHNNKTNGNSIPYNLKEFRNKPSDSDGKIRNFLRQFDPSHSYNNDKNLDWNTINSGIINILTKTYPLKKPRNKNQNRENKKQ